MKERLALFLFFLTHIAIAQTIYSDNFEIRFKKAHTNSALEIHTSRVKIFQVNKKTQKKIQVRFNVKTLTKKHIFDPNKFYLISEKHKIRLRPADIQKHKSLHFYAPFEYLTDSKIKNKKGYYWFLNHRPEIYDTFKDYKINGYKDLQNKVNFGTKQEPELYCIYYCPEKIRNKTVDVYFVVPKDFYSGIIYYGDKKIKEFTLEK